ncbi:hypothetical protein PsYK624_104710 [Phanerochaete sordida]|uniref:Uncharacterized protein n=1 Tax=Phanerochaete sordida TaxID=48140 RepID=A0A9P3LHM7_9APHY|nr:hypothetical protein PsYK624_104710 [Phanerochaete sordida]
MRVSYFSTATANSTGDMSLQKYDVAEENEDDFELPASGDIEKTWPTGTRKTQRYFHGILSYADHIAFLTEWRTQSRAGGHAETKKGKKRGEMFQIRSAMRMRYPGWHTNLGTLRAALKSRPEWAAWSQQLLGDRKEKLEVNREKKRVRKEQREKHAAKAKGKNAKGRA